MRKLGVIGVVALALVLVPAASAGAISTLASGDVAFVTGTDLVCAVSHAHGKLAVACFRWSGSAPAKNSYSVGLSADGEAVLEHVGASGKIAIVRKLQSTTGAAKNVRLANGDGFRVGGTDLACIVVGKAISCFHYSGKGSVPGSYGTVVTDSYASVVKYDAKGKAHSVVTKLQG